MSRSFFQSLAELGRVLAGPGSPTEKLNLIVPVINSDPDVAREFWARLADPAWIQPLEHRGLFRDPPDAVELKNGGKRFPIWPASKYLCRVAGAAPDKTAAILSKVKTDNSAVIADVVDAALAMPPQSAATLVPMICEAAEAGTLWLAVNHCAKLCVALAGGGQVRPAMDLARSIFTPRFQIGSEEPSRRDEYWYREGLGEVVPVLANAAPIEFLGLLCDWLNAAIEARQSGNVRDAEDYSVLWRPAIEEHEENSAYQFAGTMVGMVRKGFESALDAHVIGLGDALGILAGHTYLVFRRMELFLIGRHADQDPSMARSAMLDKDLFDDYRMKHEYSLLVGQRLSLLQGDEQERWFGWVDQGPDMSDFDESIRQHFGREATDKDRSERVEYWQFEKLHWVRSHLVGGRRVFYERMLATHGVPELADMSVRTSSRWGHESPISADELTGPLGDVVKTIVEWKPTEASARARFGREGLAEAFGQYITKGDPASLSTQAKAMVGAPAVFVRGFLGRMTEALKKGEAIDVPTVLALSEWVMTRPVEEETSGANAHERLVDPDWQWTRDEIARFVEEVCSAKNGETPRFPEAGIRERMWTLLAELCRGTPTSNLLRDTVEDDPRLHDYLDLGINSSRGKAVQAAFEYARWRAVHAKVIENGKEVVPGGFDSLPEVRDMLAWQLEPGNRRVEALSIIGSRLNLVFWIDRGWLAVNAGRLFDLDGLDRRPVDGTGWSAWNGFLVWVRPHIEFYKLFREQFAYAVDQATKIKDVLERSRTQPMNHLAEHLMLLHGRGELSFDDDNGLLRTFMERANPGLRRYAVAFVGRSISVGEALPEDVVRRLQDLWEAYWKGHGPSDAREKPGEFLFGMWFTSGKFPEPWAVSRLREFAEVVGIPEPDHAVAERLAAAAPKYVDDSLVILKSMIRGDKEGWHVHSWIDSAKSILKTGVAAGGASRAMAIEMINELGRRGFTELGELLPRE